MWKKINGLIKQFPHNVKETQHCERRQRRNETSLVWHVWLSLQLFVDRSILAVDGMFMSQSMALIVIEWGSRQPADEMRNIKAAGIRLIGNQQPKLDLRSLDCRAAVSTSTSLTQSVCFVWGHDDVCRCSYFFVLNIWSSWMRINYLNLCLRLNFRTNSTVVSLLSSELA